MGKSLDGVIIKKANITESYTRHQLEEFVKCANPITGPAYFMNHYFYIQHPVKGQILFAAFEYQERLIDIYHNFRFSISLMPRQTGKSTAAAGYLLWRAMFVPDSVILIAAHKYLGASEIMVRIRYAYELCPDFIRAGTATYNKGNIDFDNGSRIVAQATTENTGRGMSISLLYCDEFAFVRPTIAREFWASIEPTLSTGGKAMITSTPNSDEDQFWQLWLGANRTLDEFGNETELGDNGFKAFRSYWQEHPDRDEVWASQARASLGEERFQREHECEPVIFEETLINGLKLRNMKTKDPIEKMGQIRWFDKPKKDHMYLIGLDPAMGTGGHYAAIQIFELPGLVQIGEWMSNKVMMAQQVALIQVIAKYLAETTASKNIYYSVENNSLGEAALTSIRDMGEENIPGTFLSQPKKKGQMRKFRKGFNTTDKVKIEACCKTKSLIETGRMIINSAPLISQLKTFVAVGPRFQARVGEYDDLVSALIIIVRMSETLKKFDPALEEYLRDHLDTVRDPMPFIMV